MAADRHLPEIRDFQPDPAWKQFFADAIDPARHKGLFKDVRDYLAVAEAGGAAGMDAEEALSKAEAKLQEFDGIRQYCAEAIARWHAAAQIRRAQKKRTRSNWPQVVANHLAETVGGSKEDQWDAIPESEGIFLDIDGEKAEVYRDGEKLCCASLSGIKEIAYSSFHRRYLKSAKGR
ncbi:hypothetical protein [Mesorhizobium sp. M00.F.Ca.ET.217.01.1.1]|uniref:hypothetical protein n=1 Tax=Mesorhizobium sp. M00.F.Ca.ET.217.01.1.1 TaxID=2500529 RepID=UPI000FD84045|nr:hypothetical protein [Mesorhizobium sp. M00.F.Ca.ET.217.01.1.1]TGQ15915.1 hypothetical protein EN860_025515 [Mesorhizobium sp. M00.F.Ca.ET.217.01.1.1]TGV87136.1 hypothetical protein EN801_026455 [Mesorhizobium sp. M00.F.Ca.ET.158.01.1.1]